MWTWTWTLWTSQAGGLQLCWELNHQLNVSAFNILTHRYVKMVAVWDLIVDDGLYIDRLQLELYGDINEPYKKENTNR